MSNSTQAPKRYSPTDERLAEMAAVIWARMDDGERGIHFNDFEAFGWSLTKNVRKLEAAAEQILGGWPSQQMSAGVAPRVDTGTLRGDQKNLALAFIEAGTAAEDAAFVLWSNSEYHFVSLKSGSLGKRERETPVDTDTDDEWPT